MTSSKPVLALLHGWGMNARVFDALADALAPDFAVRALNLPGHGGRAALSDNSLSAWAEDLVQALPDASIVLGWSLGGLVALRAALDAPQKISRLILLSVTPRFVTATDWACAMQHADLEALGADLRADTRATLLRFLSLQTRGMAQQKTRLYALRHALLASPLPQPEALAAGLAILQHTDMRADIPAVAQPTLVLHGALDTLAPPAAGAWLAAHLPDACEVNFAPAAHAPHLSHCAEVAAAIRANLHDAARMGMTQGGAA